MTKITTYDQSYCRYGNYIVKHVSIIVGPLFIKYRTLIIE